MPVTPTKKILSDGASETPSSISLALLAGAVADEDCPWVEVGGLYLSVTIVGENSWLPLISRLYNGTQSRKKFVVFTGRHGDIPNAVNASGTTVNVFDRSHVTEDIKVRDRALKEFPGITIDLVDCGTNQKLQSQWLKSETLRRLLDNTTVIYAWCYGLFTMCEIAQGVNQKVFASHQNHMINQSVGHLVSENWNWVPRAA